MKSETTLFVFVFFMFFFLCNSLSAQSLFDKAEAGSKDKDISYELNGYLRSTLFIGKVPYKSEGEIKSGYGEASLKLRVRKGMFGDAFAEMRFRRGYEFNESISELNLREAYVNAYVGPFDFRIGHQIVAWGRADGFNPTDNITPKNMLSRSQDEDDRREGNFLIRSYYNLNPVRFEAIWIPFFRSSVVPTNLLPFPSGITLIDSDYPGANLKNSTFALRLNLEQPSFDGSLSYFNGHNPFPGITANLPSSILDVISLDIFLKSYRMHVFGADFSTTVAGSFGLRGEVGYRRPHGDYESNISIPNPDLQYVVGIDKEFPGNFNVILQYIGRYVFDFTGLEEPDSPFEFPLYELELKNRMITSQQYKLGHSVSCRAEKKLLHETLKIEVLGMLNLTSEEFLLRPKLTYDIADGITFILGGELYSGPDDTLFGAIDSHLSAFFTELKVSF
ncbi:MAG: hypothetical protein JSV96_18855 [Candidatus Aminicenantes bacterium]|nr:MAG: hypothetical protein JSV96_18855 [Candidatus Aminicenantes bacterium]